jgi:hypothetical protein
MRHLIGLLAIACTVFVAYNVYGQIEAGLPVLGTLALFIPAALLALFWSAKLEAQVRPDDVYVRYTPFHWSYHPIGMSRVVDLESKTYSPIKEYGGYGIRCGWGGSKAYNVKGNRGVFLKFNDGKSLLIGSQKPEELEAAIRSVWRPSA